MKKRNQINLENVNPAMHKYIDKYDKHSKVYKKNARIKCRERVKMWWEKNWIGIVGLIIAFISLAAMIAFEIF
ncbi:MAG: hypothetical protein LUH03_02755 [Oscillospiraceae bacterium]|nr:hypothetical protein [Oscillospiraceae bacterium]